MKKFFIDLGMAFVIVISASGCAGNSANTNGGVCKGFPLFIFFSRVKHAL